jgi:hypothetical protein
MDTATAIARNAEVVSQGHQMHSRSGCVRTRHQLLVLHHEGAACSVHHTPWELLVQNFSHCLINGTLCASTSQ